MLQNSSDLAESLLHLLLDRFESPKARVRDITQPIDYTVVGGPAAQDEFHRILHDAERAGGIALEQERLGRFTGEYARVRLTNADSLYSFLARKPSATIADMARNVIAAAIPAILEEPFFSSIEREAYDSWKANKSALGLPASQVENFITIIKLAHGIVHYNGMDIDHRTFSRRVAKDSKALEHYEVRVAQLLKRYDPKLPGHEAREILEASGIVRRAHLLQVKGPLQLLSDALQMDGTGQVFVGLPWLAVRQASLNRPVDYVLTIENPTSFWRYCTEVPGNYLALLTDGFPARDVLSGIVHLVKIARAAANAPIYHWGDIDAGGLRIAAHLENAFGTTVYLHQMTPALAAAYGTPLRSRAGLEVLSSRPGGMGELSRWLASGEGKALEQEELDPIAPMGLRLTNGASTDAFEPITSRPPTNPLLERHG